MVEFNMSLPAELDLIVGGFGLQGLLFYRSLQQLVDEDREENEDCDQAESNCHIQSIYKGNIEAYSTQCIELGLNNVAYIDTVGILPKEDEPNPAIINETAFKQRFIGDLQNHEELKCHCGLFVSNCYD